jgi:hypothetical protein
MQNTNKRRILAAFAFGFALVLMSITFRPDSPQAVTGTPVDSAPAVAIADRGPIAVTDSNQDGVPDWQEAFSNDIAPTILPDTTNGTYETEETLTDQFAREFFEQMVSSDLAGGFGETPDELIERASNALVGVGEDTLYTEADLTTQENASAADLAAYGEAVARMVIDLGCAPETADAEVFSAAVRADDPALLEPLQCRTETYALYEETLLSLTVPRVAASAHLDLLNVMQAMHHNLLAFEGIFDDPLQALVRVKRYDDDVTAVDPAINNLYQTLVDNGANWSPTSPVFELISIE